MIMTMMIDDDDGDGKISKAHERTKRGTSERRGKGEPKLHALGGRAERVHQTTQ